MKVYGLQIGSTGLEFGARDDREKAMLTFTRSTTVEVSMSAGLRYKKGTKSFATYERETEENTQNCQKCDGQFSSETCSVREVPKKDWTGKWVAGEVQEVTLCDGCYRTWLKDKKLAEAKALVKAADAE